MPKYIVVDLSEMAVIVRYGEQPSSKDYRISIFPERHPNPHFHFQYKTKGDNDFFIVTVSTRDFEIMKFKEGRKRRLPKEVFDRLIKVLKSERPPDHIVQPGTTQWQYLIYQWDENVPEEGWKAKPKDIANLDDIEARGNFIYNASIRLERK